ATSGAVSTPATVDVTIGVASGGVTLQASPSTISATNIPAKGITVQLSAQVRDDQGQPLANAVVNFSTELGTLAYQGRFLRTDANGSAQDTLTIKSVDLSSNNSSSFQVMVQASGSSGSSNSASFSVKIQRDAPIASFVAQANGGNSVFFKNTTT